MDIWASINDAGALYVATNEVHTAWSDHALYVWVNAPSTTATAPAPWSKSGTVASYGTATNSALFALLQEESTGFSQILRWNGTTWTVVATPDALTGFDGTADGTGVVEGVVNLAAVLGVTAAAMPSPLYFAVAPYGTADGGALDSANQYPDPTTADGNVTANETLLVQRSAILVGNVM
jgi:hypothetical protein